MYFLTTFMKFFAYLHLNKIYKNKQMTARFTEKTEIDCPLIFIDTRVTVQTRMPTFEWEM